MCIYVYICKYFLFLHETYNIETLCMEQFEGTDFENGNGFLSNFSQNYANTKFQKFLNETLSELNFISSNLFISL